MDGSLFLSGKNNMVYYNLSLILKCSDMTCFGEGS